MQVLSLKLDVYTDSELVYTHLFGEETVAFWLDSSQVEPGLSRFSFMGDASGPHSMLIKYQTKKKELFVKYKDKITITTESIFDYLQREIDHRACESGDLPFDFNCGFVGYFGYELKAECGGKLVHSSPLPDSIFLFADRIIVSDHQEECMYLVCYIEDGEREEGYAWFKDIEQQLLMLPQSIDDCVKYPEDTYKFSLRRPYITYKTDIRECLRLIKEGETYEVCLTNKFTTNTVENPLTLYRNLRKINPAPYATFLCFKDVSILCSSPERFLKIDRNRWVESKPIKGTAPRGTFPEEDEELHENLRLSAKDRAENLMIVDLVRNDIGKVCEIGSVHVPKLMEVESYATVHQLVSSIKGKLRFDKKAIDCIRAVFPGGSMTGAPKIRTMKIIDQLEREARGVYSGTIGFLALNGCVDLNIVIRTMVITSSETQIGVGGAIVALSDPEDEYKEIILKGQALMQALGSFAARETIWRI